MITVTECKTLPAENPYGHKKKLRFMLSELAALQRLRAEPLKVLDFGCGNGTAVGRHIIQAGYHYLGVDIHPPSLEYARAHYAGKRARFDCDIPEGESYDVIIYGDFLEHVPQPDDYLRRHSKLLRPGGRILASVPNAYGAYEIEQAVDRRIHLTGALARFGAWRRRLRGAATPATSDRLPYNHDSGHVVFFTRKKLERCVAAAGLQIVNWQNGAFLGGSITGIILERSPLLLKWNVAVADWLPYWAVSTWYFTLKLAGRD